MILKRVAAFLICLALVQMACSMAGYTISPTDPSTSTPPEPGVPQPTAPVASGSAASLTGRVLWNGTPVDATEVILCGDMNTYSGCVSTQQSTVSGPDGVFRFENVQPGEYVLMVHSIDSDTWQYETSGVFQPALINVLAGQQLEVGDKSLFKSDLTVLSPLDGDLVGQSRPAFKWQAYPGASYYEVYLAPDGLSSPIFSLDHYTATEITPERALLACEYSWRVRAYNTSGDMIAETDGFLRFSVVDQPASCKVQVISPADKTSLPARSGELTWQAHPLASYYTLVVWKGEVGGERVVDYARVDGQPHFLFEQTLDPDTYIWSVSAYDESGLNVATSDLYNFSVQTGQ